MKILKAGSAAPVGRTDVFKAAGAFSVDPALLAAFMSVECGWRMDGRLYGYGQNLMLRRRFEKHHFGKYLRKKVDRTRAVGQNLITKKWTPGQPGGTAIFARAWAINPHATMMASSFGLSQIMGFNHKEAGFRKVETMVDYMARSERHQLDVTMRLMEKMGVIREMREGDYNGMARIWNGSGYARHGYHIKLQQAHVRFKRIFNGGVLIAAPSSSVLRLGNRGKVVKNLQLVLIKTGASIEADGDFGPATKQAVVAFQLAMKLTADGIVGPATMEALEKAMAGA